MLFQRHILLVVSSNSSGIIEKILFQEGPDRYFEAILGLEFTLSKTDKIHHALAHFRATRQDTVAVLGARYRWARMAGKVK